MYDSAGEEEVSNSVYGNPSLRTPRLVSECSYWGAALSRSWSRHPAFCDMRTGSCKMTTTCTAA